MDNLYEELIKDLKAQGKTTDDIIWVGNDHVTVPVEWFLEQIKKYDYDSGFGCEEVSLKLLIVGKDWWLERHEYDGSEWFEFKTLPTKPDIQEKINIWEAKW